MWAIESRFPQQAMRWLWCFGVQQLSRLATAHVLAMDSARRSGLVEKMNIGAFLRLSYMAGRKSNDVVDGVVCGGPASKLRPNSWSCSYDGVADFSSGKEHFETFT